MKTGSFLCLVILISGSLSSRVAFELSIGEKDPKAGTKLVDMKGLRQAYIVGSGIGSVNATFTTGNSQEQTVECTFYYGDNTNRVCMLWSLPDAQFDSKEVVSVKLDFQRSEFNYNDAFKFSIMGGDFIDVSATEKLFIIFNDVETVNVLVDFKDANMSVVKEDGGKIEYVALLPYSNSIDLAHSLTMYLKKGESRVTPSRSDIQVASKLGLGLVKTITKTDADFCSDNSCKVAIRFDAMNLDFADFFLVLKNRKTESVIFEGLSYIEELTENDQVTYVLENKDYFADMNWKFTLIPLKGNPDMAINFGSKPNSISEYRWKTNEENTEEIFITSEELKSLKLENKNVFVTIYSSEPSQYVFRPRARSSSNTHLRPNRPVSGEAKSGEIVNYVYEVVTTHPETISLFADLTAKSGNPDLYIKDCANATAQDQCVITQSDIDAWNNTDNEPYKFAVKSTSLKGDDSIYLRFNCKPNMDIYKNFTFQGDEKDLFTTSNCAFAVAVVGKPSSTHQTSKYTLQLKGSKSHEIGELNQPLPIQKGPQNLMYIKYEVGDINPKHNYLNLKFIITSGDFDVFHSRLTPYPDESNSDKSYRVTTTVGQKKSEFTHYVTIKGDPRLLKGVHYFTLSVRFFN